MTEEKIDVSKELIQLANRLYGDGSYSTISKKDLKKALDDFRKEVYSYREDMSVKQFKVQIAHVLSKTLSGLI